jgi:uncharacterized membrane-anchored protein
MKHWRQWLIVLGLALVLALVNREILAKRSIIANGEIVLLELRPVDPRSLIQGDYMALAFADDTMPDAVTTMGLSFRGTVILSLDANRVGRFQRLEDGAQPNAGEIRLRYRRYKEFGADRIAYTARSYFFEEGQAERYAEARYAILRVNADGLGVMTGMADKEFHPIDPSGPASAP